MQQKTMIKKVLLNPGAYSIFIRQINRDDGISIAEINRRIGWSDGYANSLLMYNNMPSFNKCIQGDEFFRTYFEGNPKFKRHLSKTTEVYEPIDIIDWIETELDDLSWWLNGFEQDKSNFMKSDLPSLETGDIKFSKVMLFTINIDRYIDSPIGDYVGVTMQEYQGGKS